MSGAEHWCRLPRETVESPSLGILKAQLTTAPNQKLAQLLAVAGLGDLQELQILDPYSTIQVLREEPT